LDKVNKNEEEEEEEHKDLDKWKVNEQKILNENDHEEESIQAANMLKNSCNLKETFNNELTKDSKHKVTLLLY